jgi:hypothetical protein
VKDELPPLYLQQWRKGVEPWTVTLGTREEFPCTGPLDELKHLGHTENAMGKAPSAKKLALTATREAARLLHIKQLRAAGAKYVAEAVLRSRAQYKLVFLNASMQEIDSRSSGFCLRCTL